MTRSRTLSAVLFVVFLCSPLLADEVADELRAAEIAFAASVAERDPEAFARVRRELLDALERMGKP